MGSDSRTKNPLMKYPATARRRWVPLPAAGRDANKSRSQSPRELPWRCISCPLLKSMEAFAQPAAILGLAALVLGLVAEIAVNRDWLKYQFTKSRNLLLSVQYTEQAA